MRGRLVNGCGSGKAALAGDVFSAKGAQAERLSQAVVRKVKAVSARRRPLICNSTRWRPG